VALPEFALDQMINRHGLSLDGKSKIVEELRPLIGVATSPLQRSLFVAHFAEKLGLTAGQLDAHFKRTSEPLVELQTLPTRNVRERQVAPLSMAQRQLIEFMILQPQYFFKLAEGGLRDSLIGGIGEMLFLELESLLKTNPQAEPEELLTALPEGAERCLVADLLLRVSASTSGESENSSGEGIVDLLEYLRKFQLKKQSDDLMQRIRSAEKAGDQPLMQKLMMEKIEITRKLHELTL
jgi:DNA primase